LPTITKSIGTASRDYSTITAWEADLDNGAIYASGDDAIGECYNDSDFDERLELNGGGTVGLASATLTAAATDRHDGTAGSGAKIKVTSLASYHALGADVSWLEFDNNGVTLSNSSFDFGSSPTGSLRYSNLLIHDVQSTLTTGDRPPISFSTPNNTDIVNCIIYDIDSACIGIGGVELGIGSRTFRIANCTFHDIANSHPTADHYGIYDRGINSFQNCIVTDATVSGSGTAYCLPALTDSYCLTSDATADGTGSLTNKTSANQFVSTVGGSEDLHLKAGADAIDAGTDLVTTPTGVNIDIDGRDRDAEGDTWDIGAHEYVSAGGVTANSHYYMASQAGAVA